MIPKVSIIIATFNAAGTLSAALDSILNQSFQSWECIIIDGASKDTTINIVKSYQIKDNRFRYISEPDKGIYDAFNKGWKIAKGEWIYYLGADDLLIEDALDNFAHNIDNSDIIYGNTIFNTGIRLKKVKSIEPTSFRDLMVSHQCIIMRRESIKKIGGFDTKYKISADFALIQKAVTYNMKFKHINYYIAIFQCGGISSFGFLNLFESYNIRKEFGTSSNLYIFLTTIKKIIIRSIQIPIKYIYFRLYS